jgi:hypothetical protein
MKQKLLAPAAILAIAAHELRHSSLLSYSVAEGTHLASQGVTLEADGAITERNLLMKRGGASNRVTPCDAADTPIGVCSDEAAAAGDIVTCAGSTPHCSRL